MNRSKAIAFFAVLAMMGASAAALAHAKSNQRLGLPGVKTSPLPGSQNLEVLLPDDVPGYQSQTLPQSATVTNTLPLDTSYGQRLYAGNDGFQCLANVVLMGSSRASIHKPQICLTAQGWVISDAASREDVVPIARPSPYNLRVMHLVATREARYNGQDITQKGVYVYWFVDQDRLTASHAERFMWMARDVVLRGVLDRWAYVAFFAQCAPGQEDATFEHMKKLIAATVPEFQLVPRG
jgi:hypothetical protein